MSGGPIPRRGKEKFPSHGGKSEASHRPDRPCTFRMGGIRRIFKDEFCPFEIFPAVRCRFDLPIRSKVCVFWVPMAEWEHLSGCRVWRLSNTELPGFWQEESVMRSFVYGLCLFEGSPSRSVFLRYHARASPDFYPVRLGFQTVCFDRGAGGSVRACILKRGRIAVRRSGIFRTKSKKVVQMYAYFVVPVGLEPTTPTLRVSCSQSLKRLRLSTQPTELENRCGEDYSSYLAAFPRYVTHYVQHVSH